MPVWYEGAWWRVYASILMQSMQDRVNLPLELKLLRVAPAAVEHHHSWTRVVNSHVVRNVHLLGEMPRIQEDNQLARALRTSKLREKPPSSMLMVCFPGDNADGQWMAGTSLRVVFANAAATLANSEATPSISSGR